MQCPLYGAVVLRDGLMLLEEPDGVAGPKIHQSRCQKWKGNLDEIDKQL